MLHRHEFFCESMSTLSIEDIEPYSLIQIRTPHIVHKQSHPACVESSTIQDVKGIERLKMGENHVDIVWEDNGDEFCGSHGFRVGSTPPKE